MMEYTKNKKGVCFMDMIEWIFSGIGTELLIGIIGLFIGGVAGYKIGFNKVTRKQQQTAGKNSIQFQTANSSHNHNDAVAINLSKTIQNQVAGDNAIQFQQGDEGDRYKK